MGSTYNSSVPTHNPDSNSQSASHPPIEKRFTCFSHLPKEIRFIIWEFALFADLPEPRTVGIKQRRLRKTIKDWEGEHDTTWRAGLGLPEEDDIGLFANNLAEGEASKPNGISNDEEEDDNKWAHSVMRTKEEIVDSHAWVALHKHDPFPHSFYEITFHLLGLFPFLDVENIWRVKDLAIQFEEPDEEWSGLEENLAYIMHIFKGVTNLTIILPHYLDEYRDPIHPKMVELISTSLAEEFYYDYHPHLKPHFNSDSDEENTRLNSVDEPTESMDDWMSDFCQDRVMLDNPGLSLELIDDWRKALMSGNDLRPMPKIEFRVLR